jgi:hypothetical protein
MIAVGEAGPEALAFYAVALPAVAALGWMLDKAAARFRYLLPATARSGLGYPLEGDRVPCEGCGLAVEAEAVPDPLGVDGYSLCCGACGTVLDYGEGIA